MLEFCFIGDMVQLALKEEGCDLGGIGKDFKLEISTLFPLTVTCVREEVKIPNKFGSGV